MKLDVLLEIGSGTFLPKNCTEALVVGYRDLGRCNTLTKKMLALGSPKPEGLGRAVIESTKFMGNVASSIRTQLAMELEDARAIRVASNWNRSVQRIYWDK